MNDYEYKQEQRRERYLARAQAAERISDARFKAASASIDGIPPGQPILVGHHSERRHRAALARHDMNMRKAIEADKRAKYYRYKAAGVGSGGISREDPEAVAKLKEKLADMEQSQEQMKKANAAIRKGKTPDEKVANLVALGISEGAAKRLIEPDFCGRIGFPDYAMKNNNANMRRVKQRIAELEQAAKREPAPDREYKGFKVVNDDSRIQFVFPGKPSEAVRKLLKGNAFKWSPTRGAWVRLDTANAQYQANMLIPQIEALT